MNMNNYVYRVTERRIFGSLGEPGREFEAFNLSEAKRISTRRQKVKGSILILEDVTEKPHVVATKRQTREMDKRGRDVLKRCPHGAKAPCVTLAWWAFHHSPPRLLRPSG